MCFTKTGNVVSHEKLCRTVQKMYAGETGKFLIELRQKNQKMNVERRKLEGKRGKRKC